MVLILCFIIFIVFIIFFILKYYNEFETVISYDKNIVSNADITEPKFAIKNSSQKIFVTAKEGNFIDKDEIMLKKNVKFKSKNFSIESDNVVFNRKAQTAYSEDKSIFRSENTTISADGFDIHDNGNNINFYGKAIIILK